MKISNQDTDTAILPAPVVHTPRSSRTHGSLLFNVQALRGFAAMLVVFCHTADMLPDGRDWFGATGANGVDLFFVISGFIMVCTTAGRQVTVVEFAKARIIRIVPLYWLFTFLVVMISAIMPHAFNGTRPDLREFFLSLAFIPFIKSGSGGVQPTLFVGWTLNYEMFFYLLFALSMFTRRPLLGGSIVVTVLLSLVAWGHLTHPTGIATGFYTRPIILEFGMGVLIGLAWLRWPLDAALLPLAWFGLVAGCLGFVFAPRGTLDGPFGFGLVAVLLLASALTLETAGLRASWPWIQEVGNASYAIYLSHFFLIRGLEQVMNVVPLNVIPASVATIAAMALCAMAGIAIHRGVERPMTNALRRWAPKVSSGLAETPLNT